MTLGYHIVKSGYGLWLPGDARGSWSEAWDDELGYIEPHTLHGGDPVRLRMAEERMKRPPVLLTDEMLQAVVDQIGRCAADSPWSIVAASVERTHTHLQMTYSGLDVYNTVKWIGDQTTKAVHRLTPHAGPIWCKGSWISFVFDEPRWKNVKAYIERHNIRRGVGPQPYPFVRAGL